MASRLENGCDVVENECFIVRDCDHGIRGCHDIEVFLVRFATTKKESGTTMHFYFTQMKIIGQCRIVRRPHLWIPLNSLRGLNQGMCNPEMETQMCQISPD